MEMVKRNRQAPPMFNKAIMSENQRQWFCDLPGV